MLSHLNITNIVLMDQLALECGEGLCVMTGETGSGKSIILDALGLVLGKRLERRLLRKGSESGQVTASFDLPNTHPAHAWLNEHDLASDNALIIRRSLTVDGKNRAFINGVPATQQQLKSLGAMLIELHGQHDQQGLLNEKFHAPMLDAFASLTPHTQQVATHHQQWKQTIKAKEQLIEQLADDKKEEEYLTQLVQELGKLAPEEGEETTLQDERQAMREQIDAAALLTQAMQALEAEPTISERIHTIERQNWSEPQRDELTPLIEQCYSAYGQLEDKLRHWADANYVDSNRLDSIESRLYSLRSASRKFHTPPEQLPALLATSEAKILMLQQSDDQLQQLEQAISQHKQAYVSAATELRSKRQSAATKLATAIMQELAPLKLDKAKFRVALEPLDESAWHKGGMDAISFQLQTNPGSPEGALSKVASGGELSRLMLAIKLVLAETDAITTMIFDEIDTGIGGATASAVGSRLARLARSGKQVFVVTHQPQVAAYANHHWRIGKRVKDNITISSAEPLALPERQEELARMLAGDAVTDEARNAAAALMEQASHQGNAQAA